MSFLASKIATAAEVDDASTGTNKHHNSSNGSIVRGTNRDKFGTEL
jgi:hypothetical protein